jgi:predicted amidohydrolase YtcJ
METVVRTRWPTSSRRTDPTATPELLLTGGRILHGPVAGPDADTPGFAEALAVTGSTIQAIGETDRIEALAGPGTTVVDLDGRTVVPGLHDSHLHVLRGGLTWTDEVLWFEVPTLDDALGRLRDEVARRPSGTWIRVVGGWHPGQFREQRGPSSAELTDLAPDHPVYVQLLYEEAVLNDAAMRAAGITAEADDPPLGSFERDPDTGEPTGVVRGIGAFNHCLGRIPALADDDQVTSTAAMLRHLTTYGLTGAIDPGGFGMTPEAYMPVFQLWRDRALTLKVRTYVCPVTRGDEVAELTAWLRHAQPGFGDAWLRHLGIGEIAHFGCHDLEGLTDFTVSNAAKQELEAILLDAARRGWPVHMHAVLDDTASAILDVWERVDVQASIRSARWSLAHAEPISDRNLDRVAALGAGIAVQDRLVYRATDSARVWGEEAVRGGPPLRSILERGIPLGAGSDATRVASPNPWVSLWWLVTGRTFDDGPERDPSQCLTRLEALAAYTSGSAWFAFEEHDRGTIEVGMAADLAVLSDDYFTVDDDAIRRLRSDLTIVEGRPVHAVGAFDGLA